MRHPAVVADTDDMIAAMAKVAEKHAQAVFRDAQERWREALEAHRAAPPDAGFSARIAGLAEAARAEAGACREAEAAGFEWPPHRAASSKPPHELQSGSGRRGPEELWRRFAGPWPSSIASPPVPICSRWPASTTIWRMSLASWRERSSRRIVTVDCCPVLARAARHNRNRAGRVTRSVWKAARRCPRHPRRTRDAHRRGGGVAGQGSEEPTGPCVSQGTRCRRAPARASRPPPRA